MFKLLLSLGWLRRVEVTLTTCIFVHYVIQKYYWCKQFVFKRVHLMSVYNRKEQCNIGKYLENALYLRSQYIQLGWGGGDYYRTHISPRARCDLSA